MKKVIIAMSGGVDSSVAAVLLKEQGYEVVGVFFNLWPSFDSKRARLVAKKLGIEFHVFDLRKEFKNKVVDYFVKEYKLGRTPNPCVICNKEIKFEFLFKKLKKLKADYIATGHYAHLRQGRLFKAKDKNKDQSYFLWKLNRKILKKALFPIGDYTKPKVRSLAKEFNLPVLNISESQEICFSIDFEEKPGPIMDIKDKVIGQHKGLCFYTIGQRKGIELPAGPYFVLDKNIKKNSLIVTKNEKDLYKKELTFKNPNWFSKPRNKVSIKIRYRHKQGLGIIKKNKVIFDKPQRAITPGQSVVFYKGQELLGGGVIT